MMDDHRYQCMFVVYAQSLYTVVLGVVDMTVQFVEEHCRNYVKQQQQRQVCSESVYTNKQTV